MQELEKILEKIIKKSFCVEIREYESETVVLLDDVEEILEKHMNDGWIPVEQELPPNSKHKGALCPRYQVMTKYGVTEGWYNPDYESWYILCWFMGADYLETEIDFEKGTYPKVVRCENSVNDKHGIVIAWRPPPDPYRSEKEEQNNDGE